MCHHTWTCSTFLPQRKARAYYRSQALLQTRVIAPYYVNSSVNQKVRMVQCSYPAGVLVWAQEYTFAISFCICYVALSRCAGRGFLYQCQLFFSVFTQESLPFIGVLIAMDRAFSTGIYCKNINLITSIGMCSLLKWALTWGVISMEGGYVLSHILWKQEMQTLLSQLRPLLPSSLLVLHRASFHFAPLVSLRGAFFFFPAQLSA